MGNETEKEASLHHVGKAFSREVREETKGWFIGDFLPEEAGVNKTDEMEVAMKLLKPGDIDEPHTHSQSVELCLVVKGTWRIVVNGEEKVLRRGDYILSAPGSVLSYEIPSESEGGKPVWVMVVRAPGVNDKVPIEEEK